MFTAPPITMTWEPSRLASGADQSPSSCRYLDADGSARIVDPVAASGINDADPGTGVEEAGIGLPGNQQDRTRFLDWASRISVSAIIGYVICQIAASEGIEVGDHKSKIFQYIIYNP